ncbi:MAG: hypothetical protein INR62_07025 [Rhodospirillales bacterium]|nr:hypothetical protein [Acetobacter sp.]
MSPTLLELVVVVLLLYVAWQIASRIGPSLLASLVAYWRSPRPPVDSDPLSNAKNVTPTGTIPPPRKDDPVRK